MVQSCCAINCTVRRNKDVKLKFLSIPKDPVRRKQWLVAIRRENFNPSARAVICENHFTKDDFELNVHGNRVLKKTSVPSVFNFPVHLEKKVLARRPLKRKITETEHLNTADDVTAGTSDTNTEVILEVSSNVVEYMDVDNEQTSEQTTSTSTSHQKEFSKRRRRDPVFFRDFHENDLNDEVKRIRFWKVAHNTIAKSRKLNRYYQCVTSRQKQKIKNLNLLLDELMKKENISSEQQLVLKLPNDMENYMRYHVMGSVSQVRMKSGCIPTKFTCQPDRKTRTSDTIERPYIRKKRKMMAFEECMVTEYTDLEEIGSRSPVSPNKEENMHFGDLEYLTKSESEQCDTSSNLIQDNVEIKEEPLLEIKEEPLVDIKEEPLVEIKEEPLVDIKEELLVEIKNEPLVKIKEEPLVEIKEEPLVEIKIEQND